MGHHFLSCSTFYIISTLRKPNHEFFSKLILSIHSWSLILKIEFVINGRSTKKIGSKPSSKLTNHIPDSSRFVAYRFVRVFIRFAPIKACVCLFPIWLRDTFSFSLVVPYSDDFFKSKVNSVLLFLKIISTTSALDWYWKDPDMDPNIWLVYDMYHMSTLKSRWCWPGTCLTQFESKETYLFGNPERYGRWLRGVS